MITDNLALLFQQGSGGHFINILLHEREKVELEANSVNEFWGYDAVFIHTVGDCVNRNAIKNLVYIKPGSNPRRLFELKGCKRALGEVRNLNKEEICSLISLDPDSITDSDWDKVVKTVEKDPTTCRAQIRSILTGELFFQSVHLVSRFNAIPHKVLNNVIWEYSRYTPEFLKNYFPNALIHTLDYDKIFFDGDTSGTIVEKYSDEIRQYHLKNEELLSITKKIIDERLDYENRPTIYTGNVEG